MNRHRRQGTTMLLCLGFVVLNELQKISRVLSFSCSLTTLFRVIGFVHILCLLTHTLITCSFEWTRELGRQSWLGARITHEISAQSTVMTSSEKCKSNAAASTSHVVTITFPLHIVLYRHVQWSTIGRKSSKFVVVSKCTVLKLCCNGMIHNRGATSSSALTTTCCNSGCCLDTLWDFGGCGATT